jgi:uncharacterized delta-60 repeat protein
LYYNQRLFVSILGGNMKRLVTPATVVILAALAACSSNLAPPSKSEPKKILGVLEVKIEGIGESSAITASATVQKRPSGLQAQAVTVVPETGLTFTRKAVSFADIDEGTVLTRFTQATFEIKNTSGINFDNLTLHAYNDANVSVAGSAMSNIVAANGQTITDPGVVQSLQPAHGMNTLSTKINVGKSVASLQFFKPQEVAGAGSVQADAEAAGYVMAEDQVLEYGFVATNKLGERALNSGTGTCTNLTCGYITLAYKFPRSAVRAENPWAFNIKFVIANDSETIYSQSKEEQKNNTASGRNLTELTSADKIRTVEGSSLYGDKIDPLCYLQKTKTTYYPISPLLISAAAGTLDVCFGSSGQQGINVSTAFGDDSGDEVGGVGLQNGRIIIVGTSAIFNGSSRFSLIRLFPNGALDKTFGSDGTGKVFTPIGLFSGAQAVAIQSDNKIVVAGWSKTADSSYRSITVLRYSANGVLDSSFGTAGVALISDPGFNMDASKVYVQSDGSILITGSSKDFPASPGDYQKFMLIKLDSGGTLVPGFGSSGVTRATGGYNAINYIGRSIVQTDGKIIMVGHESSYAEEIILCRFNTDGSLGTKFKNGSGCVNSPSNNGQGRINALALQSNGKIIGAGQVNPDGGIQVQVGRWNTDGTEDATFSGNPTSGYPYFRGLYAPGGYGSAFDVLVQPADNRIVLAGLDGVTNQLWLARLNSDGSTDTVFSTNARRTRPPNVGPLNTELSMIRQPNDNKITVAGGAPGFNGYQDFALVRVHP